MNQVENIALIRLPTQRCICMYMYMYMYICVCISYATNQSILELPTVAPLKFTCVLEVNIQPCVAFSDISQNIRPCYVDIIT